MQKDKMKRLSLLAILLVNGLILWAQSDEIVQRVDSCRKVAATQSGRQRLQTLEKMQQISTFTDKDFELGIVQEFEDEAIKQGDAEMTATAKYRKVCVFGNHLDIDKCLEEADREMEACRHLGVMDVYYRIANLKGEKLLFQGKPLAALHFITPIMKSATKANDTYGKAACSDLLGQIYNGIGDYVQAEQNLLEAIKQYKQLGAKGINGLLDAYFKISNVYFTTKEHDKVIQLTNDYKQQIIAAEKAGTENINFPARYGLCYFLRGVAAHGQGNAQEVISSYKKMMYHTDNGRILNTLIPTLEMYSVAAQGDYQKAIDMADKHIAMYKEADMELSGLIYVYDKTGFLEAMGKHKEANELLHEYILKVDKLRGDESLKQQNEFAALYELEKKEARAQLMRSWLTAIVISCILLILFAGFVVYHNRRLRQKNHSLYLQYQKQKQAEMVLDNIMEQNQTNDMSDKEIQLFIKVRQLLKNKELLADPLLDRNLLAEKLYTNYTYVSKAVQKGANMSVNRYISQARVDYACELLRKEEHTLFEIQDMCGFQSRTSFNRAFKEVTQITPISFQKEMENK